MEKVNLGRLCRVLDKLKQCADEKEKGLPCLTHAECRDICTYIWWLTDQVAKAKTEKPEEN